MLAARLIGQRVISIHMLAVGVRVSPSGGQGRGRGAGEGEEGTQLSNSNGGPSNSIITTKSTSSLPTRGPPPTSNEGLQHSALLFAA